MSYTRRGRLEEVKQKKLLVLGIFGSISVLIFLGVFGFKILIGFSVLIDKIRGTSPQTTQNSPLHLFAPVLDPLPIATKSGTLRITGSAEQNTTIIIYVDSKESKKSVVAGNGNFIVNIQDIKDGNHSIQAKITDNNKSESELTEPVHILIKSKPPILEVLSPEDNASVNGDRNFITVSGNTENDTSVTLNGRFVVVKTDNSFTYEYPLSEGENILTIEAKDEAGNSTKTERKVTYRK